MSGFSGDSQIYYDGRIYNAKEIKKKLQGMGFSFAGDSDEELLLKAYENYGYDVVKHLNGVFAFAIWDSEREEIFLARDHFGIKPLYYSVFNDDLIFASEIKSILKQPGFQTILDKQGICELFGIGPAHTGRNMCV